MKEARLVSKKDSAHKSIISLFPGVSCGEKELVIIGGPCSVENMEQMQITTRKLEQAPVQGIRGGVYKPRTSPYAFQGMGEEGLKILAAIKRRVQRACHHRSYVSRTVTSMRQIRRCFTNRQSQHAELRVTKSSRVGR